MAAGNDFVQIGELHARVDFRGRKPAMTKQLLYLSDIRGASQPTLDVIRRLAVALQVSADVLIFGADERGPDGDLRLQFEAISNFPKRNKLSRLFSKA
jgi:hypothetical protein